MATETTRTVLSGVRVDFPYEPYEVQVNFMQRAINALLAGENALLESPTGTGKTLCLLCASLSWQKRARNERKKKKGAEPPPPVLPGAPGSLGGFQSAVPENSSGGGGGKGSRKTKESIIIYASRTHGQLAQVVAELRKTNYKAKLTVLGSRDQLCVNDKLKHLNGFALNNACSRMIGNRGCLYRNNLEMFRAPPEVESEFLDIEDLAHLGKTQHVCPYFMSRESLSDADLVLMPYNYLFDPAFRGSVNITWKDAVLLLDEAHNVESVACEAASCDVSTTLLGNCLKELREILTALRDGLGDAVEAEERPVAERVLTLYNLVNDFVTRISQQPLQEKKTVLPGRFLLNCLGSLGINATTFQVLDTELKRCIDFLLGPLAIPVEPKLSAFARLLKLVFRGYGTESCMAIADAYKILIEEVEIKESLAKARVLHYWCFSPHIAFEELKMLGVRSFLFTSGTLSPMASYVYEFRQPFPIRLENPHVIDDDQVWVGTLSKGPTGVPLLSTFNNRNSHAYQQELGESILRILRLVNGGVLVFFPSYGLLDACIATWRKTGVGQRMESVMPVITEPRSSVDMRHTIAQFDAAVNERGKCALFAVCRGKVSEGIDFKDNKARAVIITGIPFAPAKDPKVELKKQYLDETRESQRRQCGGYLDGTGWYMQSATRAVNQAVGRVIRHRRDWGAIILLDQRFAEQRYSSQLSSWLRHRTQAHDIFAPGLESLRSFLQRASTNPALVQASEPEAERRERFQRDVPEELIEAQSRSSARSRTAVIDAGKLEHDTSYVEPELLLTQNTTSSSSSAAAAAASVSWATKTINKPPQRLTLQYESPAQEFEQQAQSPDQLVASLKASLGNTSGLSAMRPPSQPQRKEQTLAALFQKRSGSQPAAAAAGSSTPLAAQRQSSLSRSVGLNGDLTRTVKPAASTSHATLKTGLRGSGLGLGLSGADWDNLSDPVPSLSHPRSLSLSQTSDRPSSHEHAQPAPCAAASGTQLSQASQHNAQAFLAQLRETLEPEMMAKFRRILQHFKQNGGLNEASQVQQFAKLIAHLFKGLRLATATELAEKMVSFIPEQFREMYLEQSTEFARAARETSASATAAMSTTDARTAQPAVVPAPAPIAPAAPSFVGDFRQHKQPPGSAAPAASAPTDNQTARSLGSKRSLAMQALASKRQNTGATQAAAQQSSKLLETLSNMKLPTATSTAAASSSCSKGQNLVCAICDTQATRPAAARCGHVCCEECWRTWLKPGRETCVLCRKPTTVAELTRLIVR